MATITIKDGKPYWFAADHPHPLASKILRSYPLPDGIWIWADGGDVSDYDHAIPGIKGCFVESGEYLAELRIDAETWMEQLGHTVGEWEVFPRGLIAECKCTKCGRYVQVNVSPLPNQVEIGGNVAEGCNPLGWDKVETDTD